MDNKEDIIKEQLEICEFIIENQIKKFSKDIEILKDGILNLQKLFIKYKNYSEDYLYDPEDFRKLQKELIDTKKELQMVKKNVL